MKTAIPSAPGIERHWHLIDAEAAVLGRVASKAANLLMGKHKPKDGNYCLQNCRQAGRRTLFPPEQQSVIHRKCQYSGDRNQPPVAPTVGKRRAPDSNQYKQDQRGNDKSNSSKTKWRKVS